MEEACASLVQCAQQYREVLQRQKSIHETFHDASYMDPEANTQRYEVIGALYRAKIAYAKMFHGPHFEELFKLYQEANLTYVASNNSCQGEADDEHLIEHYRLFHVRAQRENELFGCVEALQD